MADNKNALPPQPRTTDVNDPEAKNGQMIADHRVEDALEDDNVREVLKILRSRSKQHIEKPV